MKGLRRGAAELSGGAEHEDAAAAARFGGVLSSGNPFSEPSCVSGIAAMGGRADVHGGGMLQVLERFSWRISLANYIVPLAIGAVAVVLVLGLFNMLRGGSPNLSQKLMRWRVVLQFVAIVIIMLTVWAMHRY